MLWGSLLLPGLCPSPQGPLPLTCAPLRPSAFAASPLRPPSTFPPTLSATASLSLTSHFLKPPRTARPSQCWRTHSWVSHELGKKAHLWSREGTPGAARAAQLGNTTGTGAQGSVRRATLRERNREGALRWGVGARMPSAVAGLRASDGLHQVAGWGRGGIASTRPHRHEDASTPWVSVGSAWGPRRGGRAGQRTRVLDRLERGQNEDRSRDRVGTERGQKQRQNRDRVGKEQGWGDGGGTERGHGPAPAPPAGTAAALTTWPPAGSSQPRFSPRSPGSSRIRGRAACLHRRVPRTGLLPSG